MPAGVPRRFPEIKDEQLRGLAETLSALPHFHPDRAWKARLKARLMMLDIVDAPGRVKRESVRDPRHAARR